MTEVFDVSLSNIDAMPDVNENQEHQISSGQLAETVNAKWLEDAKQGKESPYDKGGTVILHPGVIPINLGDFQITIWSGQTVEPGKVLLIFPHENTSYVSAPFQPSNELFHLPEQGENAVLMTEKLYYKDKENKLHVIPVFFYVDNMEGHFGDAGFFMGHGFENISIPVLSFASDDDDNKDHSGFIVVSDYLAEPMQALRDQIISDVQNGVFDPSDLSKAWFAPQNVW